MAKPNGGLFFRLTSNFWNRFLSSPQHRIPEKDTPESSNVKVIGEDYLGNLYYEQNEEGKKRRRFFIPQHEDDWDKPVPPEWEAWLRYRRDNAPTFDEINLNIAFAQLKKLRAQELMQKEQPLQLPQSSNSTTTAISHIKSTEPSETTGERPKTQWPTYPEYHTK